VTLICGPSYSINIYVFLYHSRSFQIHLLFTETLHRTLDLLSLGFIGASNVIITILLPQRFYGPFFRDHPGKLVPEENFWTLQCKRRLTEADTLTIRLGATPCGLTSAHLHHPQFFTDRMPFLPSNQCQSTVIFYY